MHLHSIARGLFGALVGAVLAVSPARAADPVFPLNSRVGLVVPAGFVPSNRFIGFENAFASAAISVTALPGEAFADIEKGLTDEALKARGMTVQLREQLALKDGRGLLVAGPQESNGAKRYEAMLIANVSGYTAIVSMQMIEASHAELTDNVIRESFKTVTVRKEIPENERQAVLPYKIGNLAGFRFIQADPGGTAILTDGPKDSVQAVEQPYVVIGVATGEVPKPEDRDKFARQVFSTLPGIKDVKITRSEPLRIGTTQGHEILAEAKDAQSGTDVTTVQWLRFGQRGHLQMFAISRRTAWSEVYPRLRAMRDSVELR